MDEPKILDRRIETIGWGALFLWWGLRWWPFASLPEGAGLLGTALILFGLNAARSLNGIPTRGFTTFLGILSLVVGGILMAVEVLHLSFEPPIFEIILITVGVALLVYALRGVRKTDFSESQ